MKQKNIVENILKEIDRIEFIELRIIFFYKFFLHFVNTAIQEMGDRSAAAPFDTGTNYKIPRCF